MSRYEQVGKPVPRSLNLIRERNFDTFGEFSGNTEVLEIASSRKFVRKFVATSSGVSSSRCASRRLWIPKRLAVP